jgi:hypothetical protein
MHTPEESEQYGQEELETLRHIFERWIKSDVTWAVEYMHTHDILNDGTEWDYLRGEWNEKLNEWINPYVLRLRQTEYITDDDTKAFVEWAYNLMEIMLQVLYKLGETLHEDA